MTLPAGTRFGPYEILSLIGAGGMGEVYRARDTRLRRVVAIKVLPADRRTDEDRRRRFLQEAQAASAFTHPHIVTVHEIESAGDLDFIVMEYVTGKSLDALTTQQAATNTRRRDSAAPTETRRDPLHENGRKQERAGGVLTNRTA